MPQRIGKHLVVSAMTGRLFSDVKAYEVMSRSRPSNKIGEVVWYRPWKKYVFCPVADTIFDGRCLTDIRDFLIEIGKD